MEHVHASGMLHSPTASSPLSRAIVAKNTGVQNSATPSSGETVAAFKIGCSSSMKLLRAVGASPCSAQTVSQAPTVVSSRLLILAVAASSA